jgi:hypothetical protein
MHFQAAATVLYGWVELQSLVVGVSVNAHTVRVEIRNRSEVLAAR